MTNAPTQSAGSNAAPASGCPIVPAGYSASSNYNNYTGLSGNGVGMRDGVYAGATTMHGTRAADSQPWIQMDLGSPQWVASAVVAPAPASFDGWGPDYLNGAALQTSTDGVNWTTVATITGTVEGSSAPFNVGATTRYLRLSKSRAWLGVGDFYATASGSTPPANGCTLTPVTYSASSNYNNYTGLSGDGSGMRDGLYSGSATIHGTRGNDLQPWIMMDLGSTQWVSSVLVTPVPVSFEGWGAQYLNNALLQSSTDGTTWNTVATVNNAVDGSSTTLNVSASVRYLRLLRNQEWLAAGDFFATVLSPPAPTGVVSYTASSNYKSYTGLTGTGAGMRDGSYSGSTTVHGTAGNDVQPWVKIDLGSTKAITSVTVAPVPVSFDGWGAQYLNGAALQYSTDGSTWTTITTISGAVDGSSMTISASVTARYVRLYRNQEWLAVGDFFVS